MYSRSIGLLIGVAATATTSAASTRWGASGLGGGGCINREDAVNAFKGAAFAVGVFDRFIRLGHRSQQTDEGAVFQSAVFVEGHMRSSVGTYIGG